MARKSVFIKVSGDLCLSQNFIAALSQLAHRHFVVICVGGGSQINEEFMKLGKTLNKHGPLGRELETFEDRQLARNILEQNQVLLQDKLAEMQIPATVIIPVLEIGSVLCHVNGDTYVETVYLGFDLLFVVTTLDRLEGKKKQFEHLPKVQVLGIDP